MNEERGNPITPPPPPLPPSQTILRYVALKYCLMYAVRCSVGLFSQWRLFVCLTRVSWGKAAYQPYARTRSKRRALPSHARTCPRTTPFNVSVKKREAERLQEEEARLRIRLAEAEEERRKAVRVATSPVAALHRAPCLFVCLFVLFFSFPPSLLERLGCSRVVCVRLHVSINDRVVLIVFVSCQTRLYISPTAYGCGTARCVMFRLSRLL